VAFADRITDYQARVDSTLDFWLPPAKAAPSNLHEVLRYAVLSGGKRLRPLLVYATGEALGIAPEKLDPIAVSIELIHAYSLVHDDLPSMDDGDLRRGRPTVHVKYGEAMATLAGDGLQILAYHALAHDVALSKQPEICTRLIAFLAETTGSFGMVGGQVMDLAAEGKLIDAEKLEEIFSRKTGALIRASVVMPSICALSLSDSHRIHLDRFAQLVGLAYQVKDDVLDIEGDTKTLGKPQGTDIRNEKCTYPSVAGLEQAKRRAAELYSDAMRELARVEQRTEALEWLSEYIVQREF